MRNVHNISVDDLRLIQQGNGSSQLSPTSDSSSSKQAFGMSSNLLASNNITDSNSPSNLQLSTFNENNESNHFNGHNNESDESDTLHLAKDLKAFSSALNSTLMKAAISDSNNNNNRLLSMQPFLVESDDDLYKDLFVPCMVYLPCRHRVTKPLEISLRLKPVDNTASTSTATTTTTIAD
jgi:hypothetical protein